MFNKNSLRTSLLFIGIILVALVVRMFTNEHELFVQSDNTSVQAAGVNCVQGENC